MEVEIEMEIETEPEIKKVIEMEIDNGYGEL